MSINFPASKFLTLADLEEGMADFRHNAEIARMQSKIKLKLKIKQLIRKKERKLAHIERKMALIKKELTPLERLKIERILKNYEEL